MAVVLCGISALEYHRTPPMLRAPEVSFEQAAAPCASGGAGVKAEALRCRANAPEAERAIVSRLLTDLKGLSLPVHVMTDATVCRRGSSRIAYHRWSEQLYDSSIGLGGELSVLTPTATLAYLAREVGFVSLCKVACELLGIFTVHRETALTRLLTSELLSRGELTPEAQGAYPDHIRAFYEVDGRPASMQGRNGAGIPWEVSFDRYRRPTNLWRRAPLLSLEELHVFASVYKGARGAKILTAVAHNVRPGTASPLEVRWLLALCLGYRRGEEGWPWPSTNRRVDFGARERAVSGQDSCVCDALWEHKNAVLEVMGEEFHADKLGFKLQSGRTTALEHLGYTVREVTHGQLVHPDRYEVAVENLSAAFGIPLAKRGKAFRSRQRELHKALNDRAAGW